MSAVMARSASFTQKYASSVQYRMSAAEMMSSPAPKQAPVRRGRLSKLAQEIALIFQPKAGAGQLPDPISAHWHDYKVSYDAILPFASDQGRVPWIAAMTGHLHFSSAVMESCRHCIG